MIGLAALLAAGALGLAQPPDLGIACHGANTTTCGRVGIAVWLRTPAQRITASVDGHAVRLRAPSRPTGYWEGFVTLSRSELGLPRVWYGTRPSRALLLHLSVTRGGTTVRGDLRVRLRPGWG